MKNQHKYNAWKANPDCDPIEGTDKILYGTSKRAVLDHLAFEEGVKRGHNEMLVRCSDGTIWFVSKI